MQTYCNGNKKLTQIKAMRNNMTYLLEMVIGKRVDLKDKFYCFKQV